MCISYAAGVCRGLTMPSRTLLGALYIYCLRVSNLFVLLRWLPRAKMGDGQQEIPSFFLLC